MNNFKGLQRMTIEAVQSCDMDIRKEVLQNIVLTGGNTLLNGFSQAFEHKLLEIAAANAKVKVVNGSSKTFDREFASWSGGSILASTGSFQNMWVTKQEFAEMGESVLFRKCNN